MKCNYIFKNNSKKSGIIYNFANLLMSDLTQDTPMFASAFHLLCYISLTEV